MCAALRAARGLSAGQRCIVLFPDSVRNYMSKFLSDDWMVSNGFESASTLAKPSLSLGGAGRAGFATGKAVPEWWEGRNVLELDLPTPMTIPPTMTCSNAVDIMSTHGFDQLPVVDEGRLSTPALVCVARMQ